MKTLVLASQSPRRKELLEKAGFTFLTLPSEVSEILEKNLTLDDALMRLAQTKAQAIIDSGKLLNLKEFLVIGADTIVVITEEVLGKPESRKQAVEFLLKLSGNSHRVMTAIALIDDQGRVATECCTTIVKFRKLTLKEINDYVDTGEPFDKAGAYAIQGEAAKFVESVEGRFDNVVGLPVETVVRLIAENGWDVSKK